MGDKSRIEWTDATWNPVTGCTKVSAGCKHCYAERLAPRVFAGQFVQDFRASDRGDMSVASPDGQARPRRFADVVCHPERLAVPAKWRRPRMVFVNSMSDLFHEDVPDEFIVRVFAVMAGSPRHTFQVLTKRPVRMKHLCASTNVDDLFDTGYLGSTQWASWPLSNVWLGVSVEDQATADERIPLLLQTPAAIRFVSYEPALGPVDFTMLHHEDIVNIDALNGRHGLGLPLAGMNASLDWVIAGGESGPKARPAEGRWFRDVRDQCTESGTPFFFKQWGEYNALCERVGKRDAGRVLDLRVWDEMPRVGA